MKGLSDCAPNENWGDQLGIDGVGSWADNLRIASAYLQGPSKLAGLSFCAVSTNANDIAPVDCGEVDAALQTLR